MKNHKFEASVFVVGNEELSAFKLSRRFEWTFYCVDCGVRVMSFREDLGRMDPTESEIIARGVNVDCSMEIVKKVLSD